MITLIREFHDEMKACVRSSDGTCSKPFEVSQGLRQGCVVSPLLLNIFIAAVLIVVLQTFIYDSRRARASTGIAAGNKTRVPDRLRTVGHLGYAIR